MTIPKWLLPVICIVAALAVGVAATLIGMRFVPTLTVEVAPETVSAPVIQSAGTVPDDPDPEQQWPLSGYVGEQDVTVPGVQLPDEDPDFESEVRRIGEAFDPAAEIRAIEAEDAGSTPSSPDDPCAATAGDPAEGCPEGVTGTILALVHPPEFGISGQAFPPTAAQYALRGNPLGPLTCEPSTTVGVPFGVLSTVPATFTVTVAPEDRPAESRSYPLDESPAVDDWNTALPSAPSADALPPLVSCTVLDGLEPSTVYTAFIIGSDTHGNIRTYTAQRFNSSGEPIRPAAEFTTRGENWVFVRGLYADDQRLEARAWIQQDGSDPTDCSAASGSISLPALSGGNVDVPEDELLALNAPLDYDHRYFTVFRVPEGATVLFCARWYPSVAGSASWEREQPLYQTTTVLSAPDRILPVIRLAAARVRVPADVADIQVVASTTEGVECGRTDIFEDGRIARGLVALCDTSILAGANARSSDHNSTLWNMEFRGDISLTTTLTKTDGSIEETTVVIPASRGNCFGTCTLPSAQAFPVPIGLLSPAECGSNNPFELNRRICPPVPGTEEGSYAALLTWTQGYTNGVHGDWVAGDIVDTSPEFRLPDFPRMNTDERIRPIPTDPITLSPGAGFTLQVDRPVHFRVHLEDVSGDPVCTVASAPYTSVIEGDVSDSIGLEFPSLCFGRGYTAVVELTDPATGLTSVYGLHSGPNGTQWGIRSVVLLPGQDVQFHYSWQVFAVGDNSWRTVRFTTPRQSDVFENTSSDLCADRGEPFLGEGEGRERLGSFTTFQISYRADRVLEDSTRCFVALGALQRIQLPIDFYTLTSTGEQRFDVSSDDGTTVRVRVWVD